MLFVESHTELEHLDLSHGGQLAACQRWVGRKPPKSSEPRAPTPRDVLGVDDLTARITAMEIADLYTKFSGLR